MPSKRTKTPTKKPKDTPLSALSRAALEAGYRERHDWWLGEIKRADAAMTARAEAERNLGAARAEIKELRAGSDHGAEIVNDLNRRLARLEGYRDRVREVEFGPIGDGETRSGPSINLGDPAVAGNWRGFNGDSSTVASEIRANLHAAAMRRGA